MSVPKIVIHTDIFLEHLAGDRRPSVLRLAMSKFFCYTTVFHAVRLFSIGRTEGELRAIEDSMAAMKLLGLNPKNARMYGKLLGSAKQVERLNVLIAGLCMDSRLPILTDRKSDFKRLKGLNVVPTKLIRNDASGAEILAAARM